ncbi:MAG: ATP-binding protein [Planctomycetota bacterium]
MTDGTEHNPGLSSMDIVNERAQIESLENAILAEVDRFNYPKASRFALKLALEEGLTNAFNHGHENLPPDTPIHVEFDVNDKAITVAIEDQGPGFRPEGVPDPTLDENLTEPHGRGIMLMRAYMTRVSHNDRGNRIELYYERPADG